jgi:hypothetical protein
VYRETCLLDFSNLPRYGLMASATVNMDSSIDESFEFHSYSLNSELAYGLNSEPYARWTYYERKLEYVYRHLDV